ncbi:MAG: DNA-directed DNA polymerase II small subunit [archaeon]
MNEKKKKILAYFLEKGYLASPDVLDILEQKDFSFTQKIILPLGGRTIIAKEDLCHEDTESKSKTETPTENSAAAEKATKDFEICINYKDEQSNNTIQEFVMYFRRRFNLTTQAIRARQEMAENVPISRLKKMETGENVSFIGSVVEKSITKNNNLIIKVEDLSSSITVIANKNNKEAFEKAKELCLDEVVGFIGTLNKDVIYVNDIVWPDLPVGREIKKAQKEEYAAFIGDLHLGSKAFLKKEFEEFISWLNGKTGSGEQISLAKKVKYLFIVGDLVDGVGIYPDQEEELDIKDIYEQYKELSKYLQKIPENITIFICPGNHDAVRISEPQPPIYNDFVEPILAFKNVYLVSNPAMITISKTDTFSGLDILLYHGFSFPYYGDSVESIRTAGGLEKTDLISNYLLKRRHLAPTHGSTMYMPNYEKDPLFIPQTIDFFITGHIHRSMFSNYRSVTCINCSCWISQTKYQEKVGLKPQPGRVAIVNLQTRKGKILKFAGD